MTPATRVYRGDDPIGFVISLNLHDECEWVSQIVEQPTDRNERKAIAQAGRAVGVNRQYVQDAKTAGTSGRAVAVPGLPRE